MRRPSAALVVAFLALLVSLGGVSFAAIPARDGDIHACYSKKTGAIELIDTQRDKFACEKNWNGIAIDTTPARLLPPGVTFNPRVTQSVVEAAPAGPRLTSPNGKFSIEVTDSGIRLTGPNALVKLGESSVEVTGGATVKVSGGATLDLTGGNALNAVSGQTMSFSAADDLKLTAKRLINEGSISTSFSTTSFDATATGTLDLRGSIVRANGNSIGGP